jgi:hypothetical protein
MKNKSYENENFNIETNILTKFTYMILLLFDKIYNEQKMR